MNHSQTIFELLTSDTVTTHWYITFTVALSVVIWFGQCITFNITNQLLWSDWISQSKRSFENICNLLRIKKFSNIQFESKIGIGHFRQKIGHFKFSKHHEIEHLNP